MSRDKVIQVQKKAQSLEQFQRSAAGEGSPLLKSLLMGAGAIVLAIVAWGAWSTHRQHQVEAFEAGLAALRLEVEGDGSAPLAPGQLQSRMQAALPRLESLAQGAPSSCKPAAQGLIATWKLELSGQGGAQADSGTPWGRLREAQRLTALGQGKEAKAILDPIRGKAMPDEPWGQAYWASQLEVDRLNGDRDQARKDLDEYQSRYKDSADAARFDKLVQSI